MTLRSVSSSLTARWTERERIVRDLGPHDAMIMRNHGLLACGATIQQAFNTMYQL